MTFLSSFGGSPVFGVITEPIGYVLIVITDYQVASDRNLKISQPSSDLLYFKFSLNLLLKTSFNLG